MLNKIKRIGWQLFGRLSLSALMAANVVTAQAQTTVEEKLAALESRIQQLEKELSAAKGMSSATAASVKPVSETHSAPFIRPAVLTTATPVAAEPLAALDPATAQGAAAPSPTVEEKVKDLDFDALGFFKGTKVDGLLDVYYLYNFNKPSPPLLPFRNFDQNAKSITLNLAEVGLTKAVSKETPVGYRVLLAVGPTADIVNGSDPIGAKVTSANFLQYYISGRVPVGKGLILDFGKFVTQHGAEVIETPSNWNYSRSLLFTLAIPYYHFGLRATYPLSDKAAIAGYIVNGWNNVIDNNGGKTYGVQLAWNPSSRFSLVQNYMSGPEQKNNNDNFRHLIDSLVTIKLHDKVSFMANFDYGRESKAAPDGTDVHWVGVAGYLKFQLAPKFALIPRFEWLKDQDAFLTGTVQQLKEFTITPEITFNEHLLTRLEYRRDWSHAGVFPRGATEIGKSQDTVAGGLIVKF